MQLTIIGCHAATPRKNAQTTAQLLEIKGHLMLIDCGEGTQMQLRKLGVKFARIQHIFISHLHGDHFYGLIGLISTFRLLGREADLHIYGPKGIKEIITLQLKLAKSWTDYALYFHELDSTESVVVFDDEKVKVSTVPLDHRVYTNGYFFEEKVGSRKINSEAAKVHGVEVCDMENLKSGKDYVNTAGELISNAQLTFDPELPKSYAFCSDTAYKEDIVPIIANSTMLYHESTFLKNHLDLAAKTKHSTAGQAAQIAAKAQVSGLILGHYSTRYGDLNAFVDEAHESFQNVYLAEDNKVFEI
ncbi:MAG: ribonuclease Z [Flavobacteriales bacterium]|jgi:ribonuclease Z|tara:strand:+ start:99 stop:1004 length:906 start_codon:yes stop_codon:yes gene_type:complete